MVHPWKIRFIIAFFLNPASAFERMDGQLLWRLAHRYYTFAGTDRIIINTFIMRNIDVKKTQRPIFVVDDDQGILDSFDVMLGDEYQLVMASDGALALKLLNHHHPDLLFLDLKIPGPDGLEVLARIRANGFMTRVVIVTAMVQEEYQKKAEQLGVYRYLNKPLDVDEIMEIAHTATN